MSKTIRHSLGEIKECNGKTTENKRKYSVRWKYRKY